MIHAPQCSKHHYLQLPRYGSNIGVHQQMNGKEDVVCVCVYTYTPIHTYIHIYKMEYYSATKRNKFLPFATTWLDLAGIMLSEISQTDKYFMISLICGIKK